MCYTTFGPCNIVGVCPIITRLLEIAGDKSNQESDSLTILPLRLTRNILGPLQACFGSDQHSKAPDRLGVQGLCEAAQVWGLSVQMQAAKEGGAGEDGDCHAAAESELGLP